MDARNGILADMNCRGLDANIQRLSSRRDRSESTVTFYETINPVTKGLAMNDENKPAEEQTTEPSAAPEVPAPSEGNTDAPAEKEGDCEAEKAE